MYGDNAGGGDPFDAVQRLAAVHQLWIQVQGWQTAPAGSPQRMAYDKLAQMHERAIAHFANC